ncbi:MAG TPA: hypothetical protein VHH36_07990 [Candidatus Thermoplasmatota archaeon]|nr:hypothetical protein [Candidatus Thermoplasmatota archaeon]
MPFLQAIREALTPEWRWPENKVVWVLRVLLVGFAVQALFIEPEFTTRPMLVTSALWGLVISFCFALVPTRRPRTLRAAEACTLGALLMHVAGHALGWYAAFAWYDTALHAVVPMVTVFILFALSQSASKWFWTWTRVTPVEVAVYMFSMAVAIGTLWEILEFAMDRLAGTREQDNLADTMIDLIADVGGALVGAVVAGLATKYGRDKGHDEISEEPKRAVPRRAPAGKA